MTDSVILQANQRGGALDGYPFTAGIDQTRNVLVAQGGAPYTEMARAGGIWNTIGAATAPIAALPTTAAITTIYNNSNTTATPFVMEVIDLFLFNLLSTAIIHNPSIWAMVCATAAPSTASLVISSQNGRGNYTSTAATRIGTGSAITGLTATGWRPFGMPVTPALETATVGTAWAAPVQGQLFVPPGCSLCLTSVDTTATGTVQLGAAWNERVLTAGSVI